MSTTINELLENNQGFNHIRLHDGDNTYTLLLKNGSIAGAIDSTAPFNISIRAGFSRFKDIAEASSDQSMLGEVLSTHDDELRTWKLAYLVSTLADVKILLQESPSIDTTNEPFDDNDKEVMLDGLSTENVLTAVDKENSEREELLNKITHDFDSLGSVFYDDLGLVPDNDTAIFINLAALAKVSVKGSLIYSPGFYASDIFRTIIDNVSSDPAKLSLVDAQGNQVALINDESEQNNEEVGNDEFIDIPVPERTVTENSLSVPELNFNSNTEDGESSDVETHDDDLTTDDIKDEEPSNDEGTNVPSDVVTDDSGESDEESADNDADVQDSAIVVESDDPVDVDDQHPATLEPVEESHDENTDTPVHSDVNVDSLLHTIDNWKSSYEDLVTEKQRVDDEIDTYPKSDKSDYDSELARLAKRKTDVTATIEELQRELIAIDGKAKDVKESISTISERDELVKRSNALDNALNTVQSALRELL
jgi:Skp family chaperone for outer membrane proteins